MLIRLFREQFLPTLTSGRLVTDGFECSTLEPPARLTHCGTDQVFKSWDGTHEKGCIPIGWYRVTLTRSPKFGRLLPLLHVVPRFDGIRIHAGNTVRDTKGCILVGERDGHVLVNSRDTEKRLVEILKQVPKDEEIYIDITTPDRFIAQQLPDDTESDK